MAMALSGKVIVFSGFRDDDLKASIVDAGGRVTTAISNKTNLIVFKEGGKASSKTAAADVEKVELVVFCNEYGFQVPEKKARPPSKKSTESDDDDKPKKPKAKKTQKKSVDESSDEDVEQKPKKKAAKAKKEPAEPKSKAKKAPAEPKKTAVKPKKAAVKPSDVEA